jgi:hypothetical protein
MDLSLLALLLIGGGVSLVGVTMALKALGLIR